MQVIVHYPKTEDALNNLTQNVTELHVQSMINYIRQMQLSEEDVKKLIGLICQNQKSE